MKRLLLAPLVVFLALLVGSAASLSVSNAATLQLAGGSLMTFTAAACESSTVDVLAVDFDGNSDNANAVEITAGSACGNNSFRLMVFFEDGSVKTNAGELDGTGYKHAKVVKFKSADVVRILLTIDGWAIASHYVGR